MGNKEQPARIRGLNEQEDGSKLWERGGRERGRSTPENEDRRGADFTGLSTFIFISTSFYRMRMMEGTKRDKRREWIDAGKGGGVHHQAAPRVDD